MAQDITLLGATYPDVPGVTLPTDGGGTATFYDVSEVDAVASDVKAGKIFISSTGSIIVGTGEFEMFIASYGHSTYAEVLAAYQANQIVYCRASSNASNPGSGNQLRMAFLAYVNAEATPTEFEFQYYRSVATHSDAQQGDQVYVYKLKSSGGWEFSVREAYTKVKAGTGLSGSYSDGAITLENSNPLPSVSAVDNGKILRVANGAWEAESLPSASGVSF